MQTTVNLNGQNFVFPVMAIHSGDEFTLPDGEKFCACNGNGCSTVEAMGASRFPSKFLCTECLEQWAEDAYNFNRPI